MNTGEIPQEISAAQADILSKPVKQSWVARLRSDSFHFARYGKRFVIAPAVIFLTGLVLFFILGFNLGLDFTGGSIVKITADHETIFNDSNKNVYIAEIKNDILKDYKIDVFLEKSNDSGNILTVKFAQTDEDKVDSIINAIKLRFGEENVSESDAISASTSSEKIITVFVAVLLALLGILIYMLFRFKFTSGIASLIALCHDVFIMMALVIIFRIQINSAFIAALITIIGYSINNSLVVFDRVRDYEKHNSGNLVLEEILDKSIKDTLNRTMHTTITTVIPVIILAVAGIIIGLPSLTEFAVPIIFGLIAGTYSSVLLIAPMYLRFESARLTRLKRKSK
jgi:preprotein translocase subunit SecF